MNGEIVGSNNTIGQMASVLKKLQKATFTFTFMVYERVSLLRYTYIALLVLFVRDNSLIQAHNTYQSLNQIKHGNCFISQ